MFHTFPSPLKMLHLILFTPLTYLWNNACETRITICGYTYIERNLNFSEQAIEETRRKFESDRGEHLACTERLNVHSLRNVWDNAGDSTFLFCASNVAGSSVCNFLSTRECFTFFQRLARCLLYALHVHVCILYM